MLFGEGVSCRILNSIFSYLYNQLPRLGKRELICLLLFGFCTERFPLPLGAWDGLRYFIVALPVSSIYF